jgi:release factor glutamine methyltransferase
LSLEQQPKPITLASAWRLAADDLRQAGVEEADADAELLLLYLLGISKTELLRDWREPFPVEKSEQWNQLLKRRKSGVPVQYIIGQQHFYGRGFEVTESVLIPRPETELLAEAVLEIGDRMWPASAPAPLVLDVGTGSGILAITLATERPEWNVTASDLSSDALEVARRNAERNGAIERITFIQGDLLTPFLADRSAFDILVSNPPYIASSDIAGLQREVRDHEPRMALDGGEDGLHLYRIMANQLGGLSRLPRLVAWEVGAGQAEDVASFLRVSAHWDEIRFVKDYAGIDRHVLAIR